MCRKRRVSTHQPIPTHMLCHQCSGPVPLLRDINLPNVFLFHSIWNNFIKSWNSHLERESNPNHLEKLGSPLSQLSYWESDHMGINRDSITQFPGQYCRTPLKTETAFENHYNKQHGFLTTYCEVNSFHVISWYLAWLSKIPAITAAPKNPNMAILSEPVGILLPPPPPPVLKCKQEN